MVKYELFILSEYTHQEGYLNKVFNDMVNSGKAIFGLGIERLAKLGRPIQDIEFYDHLIKIVYDKNNNPLLLVPGYKAELVKKDLKKRLVRVESSFLVEQDSLWDIIDNDIVHQEIQKNFRISQPLN